MFKLIRILNSGRNTPEPIRLPVTAGVSFKIGTALTVTSGKLANCTATTVPSYIAAQDLAAGESGSMLAYPVSHDMIFEAPVSAAPTSLVPGAKVTLNVESSRAVGVTATTTNGIAEILSLAGATKTGDRIEVRF